MKKSLGERIKEARKNVDFTQDELAEKVSISKRTLINYEKDDQEPTISTLRSIAKICNVDEVWLFNGAKNINNEEKYKIEMLSAQVSAGAGVYNHEVEVIDTINIDKVFFKTIPNLDNLKVVEVVGDSMSPTLREGDHVVIDKGIKSYINDIYVINYGGALYVKRLQFKLDGTIIISSDNKNYEAEIFNPQENQLEFDIVGKVVLKVLR